MKRRLSAVITLVLALLLTSCKAGDTIASILGFDTYDYEGEAVLENVEPQSEEADSIREIIKILSINSPMLPEFDSATKAVEQCRDSVLNYMLCTGFSMYTGNPELMDEASKQYPGLRILTVIPADDFENFIYTYFGGNVKLTHKSSSLFSYLDKVNAYTAVSVPLENTVSINIMTCEKTEKTYRVTFQNSLGELVSPVYKALIIRREDGSMYFKYVRAVENDEK